MWEAIRANQRRSQILIGLMGAVLLVLGALVGLMILGDPLGAVLGAAGALGLWLVMLAVTFLGGEQIILSGAGARPIEKKDAPRLWNVVEEMTLAAGMGKMPRVYVVDDDLPNAFATGRRPENACITVTAGLLRRMNRDELQGVVAHEIGHIRNLDIRFMTVASIMLGSIVLLSDLIRRWLWYGGMRRRRVNVPAQAQIAIVAVTLVASIVGPLLAQVIYFACSRKREYLADATAARFTRYPPGLASALEKIARATGFAKDSIPRALVPMYIVNPLQSAAHSAGLFSTHPPTSKRVAILRSMGGGAGWADYEKAYRNVMGGTETCLDGATVRSEGSVAARMPTAEEAGAADEDLETAREVTDLLDRMVSFLLIPCVCGVRIKLPPAFTEETIGCPRCGRQHPVPLARPEVEETAEGPVVAPDQPLRFRRQSHGWESFRCTCGKVHQLSPGFRVKAITCKGCRRKIEIEGAGA